MQNQSVIVRKKQREQILSEIFFLGWTPCFNSPFYETHPSST